MHVHGLIVDDDAVSPVIGVILMVAITVILAAVIGTFAMGVGDRGTEEEPSVHFRVKYDGDSAMTITHDGGATVEAQHVTVAVDGTTAWDGGFQNDYGTGSTASDGWGTGSSKITSGDSLTIDDGGDNSGTTVRITWTKPETSSQTLATYEWPSS